MLVAWRQTHQSPRRIKQWHPQYSTIVRALELGRSTINQWFARPKIGRVSFDKVSLPRSAPCFYIRSRVRIDSTVHGQAVANTKGIAPGNIPAFPAVTLTSLTSKDKRSTPGNLILNMMRRPAVRS